MANLTALANAFGSDKGTLGRYPHRYSGLYDLLFYPLREQPITLVEMGLARGGPEAGGPVDRQVVSPSVRMWADYFPLAQIVGFDISDFSHMRMDRFHFVRGDSGSRGDLMRLAAAAQPDIVIDDASHASYHQQLAFDVMFPVLKPGGLYIIEDLHWQPRAFERRLPKVPKTGTFLIDFFERGVYRANPLLSRSTMEAFRAEVDSFACFPCFAERDFGPKLIVIRKSGGVTGGSSPAAAETDASVPGNDAGRGASGTLLSRALKIAFRPRGVWAGS